jgi:hypothetical protein
MLNKYDLSSIKGIDNFIGLSISETAGTGDKGIRTGAAYGRTTANISRKGGSAVSNDFDNDSILSQIKAADYQFYTDASGTALSGVYNHLVYIPRHYIRVYTDGTNIYPMASLTPRKGFVPYYTSRDGHVPSGLLVGAYQLTTAQNSDTTYLGSVSGQPNYCNFNMQSMYNQTADSWSKMGYVNVGTSSSPIYKQLRPAETIDIWSDRAILMMIESGMANIQNWLGQGHTQDEYRHMDTALLSHNSTDAVNYVVVPTSSTLVSTWLSSSGYNQSTVSFYLGWGSTLWTRRNVTAVEALSADSGYTKVTFDGDAVTWKANSGYYIGCNQACPAGSTDDLPSPSGIGGASRDGLWANRWRYIENPYGKFWNILDDIAMESKYANSAASNEFIVFKKGCTYSPGSGDWKRTGLAAPTTSGWTQTLQFYRNKMLPQTVGSSRYCMDDYTWSTARTSDGTSYYEVLAGGHAANGGNAGPVGCF